MNYIFKCRDHQVIANCVDIKGEFAKIRSDCHLEQSSIPTDVLTKLRGVRVEDSMVQEVIRNDAFGLKILRDCWGEIPDDFPFTLELQG